MSQRMDPDRIYSLQPALPKALISLGKAAVEAGLSHPIIDLVKLRASQLNGCAYCMHMHSAEARSHGIGQERLDVLPGWRETDAFSARERAALEFAEQVTLIAQGPPSDAAWAALSEHFSEAERVNLFAVLVAINGWNRIAVSFGLKPKVKADSSDAHAA